MRWGDFAVRRCGFGELAEFGFGLGDFAVLELGGALEIALAGLLFGLEAEGFEVGFEFGDAADGAALLLPAGAEGLGFFADFGEFFLEDFEALAGGFVLLALEGGLLDFEGCGLAFEVVDLGGDGADLVGEGGGGLVDQIDGLVGEEAVGDVAVGEGGGGDDGGVLDADLVVRLVALAQAAQDVDGVFDVGLADVDDLEAALEGGVLLDVFAVLVEGGCADGAQAAASEGGLEHVAGVHGSLGRACAD